MKKISRASCCLLLLVVTFVGCVKSRHVKYGSVVSDGIGDGVHYNQSSLLLVEKMEDSGEGCEQLYGFLPCSNSVLGHLFLIMVYEYLLFHGESYLVCGGEQVFKILGPGVFGATAFHVLGALPESLILLATGLLNTMEVAEEYVYMGVGLLAGSTILVLTLLWGTCVILGSQDLSNGYEYSNPSSGSTSHGRGILLPLLTKSGVSTDLETSYTARIMVLSVIPFLFVQLQKFPFFSSYQTIILVISLILCVVSLLVYFFYQFFEPWIQQRRLEFVKQEYLIFNILQHVQGHALGRILTDDGLPNVNVIRRMFEDIDLDGDDFISPTEVDKLLHEIRFEGKNIDKGKTIVDVMSKFDLDSDKKITKEEFVSGFTKWLDETKQAIDKQYYSQKTLKRIYQDFRPWIQNMKKERAMKKTLVSQIFQHVQRNALGSLLSEDGTPNMSTIHSLFEEIDLDGNNFISEQELRKLVLDINLGNAPLDLDEAVTKVFQEFDTSKDSMISEEEFATGITRWIVPSIPEASDSTHESKDVAYQKTWEETDKLVDDEKGIKGVDKSIRGWLHAISLMVLGFLMLAVLAEPLIVSVERFSKSVNIPSFFISFVLVPVATNARGAISALKAASHKKPRTTSLTFSEIYEGVFMNNVLGFTVLLSLVCVRGLEWDFSGEVLVVMFVSCVMGGLASFRYVFPVWTSLLAFLLYPLSLLLVYVLNDVVYYV